MTHGYIDWNAWHDQKYRGTYFVSDCEHEGDIDHCRNEVRDAGGIVDGWEWDGQDCGEAWIYYHCDSKEALDEVKRKIGDGI